MTTNIYANLPRIIEFIDIYDAGEGGAGTCPHCGAIGRYIYHFITEDGERRSAMRGCYGKFPKSRYFEIVANIARKEKEANKRGRSVASWDRDVREAINKFTDGKLSEEQVDEVIRRANAAKRAYMARRGYC